MPKNKETVYISGPMKGYPDSNFPAFMAAERFLRSQGCDVINPVTLRENLLKLHPGIEDLPKDVQYDIFMIHDLKHVPKADTMYMLYGWTDSKGARDEFKEAIKHGLETFYQCESDHGPE